MNTNPEIRTMTSITTSTTPSSSPASRTSGSFATTNDENKYPPVHPRKATTVSPTTTSPSSGNSNTDHNADGNINNNISNSGKTNGLQKNDTTSGHRYPNGPSSFATGARGSPSSITNQGSWMPNPNSNLNSGFSSSMQIIDLPPPSPTTATAIATKSASASPTVTTNIANMAKGPVPPTGATTKQTIETGGVVAQNSRHLATSPAIPIEEPEQPQQSGHVQLHLQPRLQMHLQPHQLCFSRSTASSIASSQSGSQQSDSVTNSHGRSRTAFLAQIAPRRDINSNMSKTSEQVGAKGASTPASAEAPTTIPTAPTASHSSVPPAVLPKPTPNPSSTSLSRSGTPPRPKLQQQQQQQQNLRSIEQGEALPTASSTLSPSPPSSSTTATATATGTSPKARGIASSTPPRALPRNPRDTGFNFGQSTSSAILGNSGNFNGINHGRTPTRARLQRQAIIASNNAANKHNLKVPHISTITNDHPAQMRDPHPHTLLNQASVPVSSGTVKPSTVMADTTDEWQRMAQQRQQQQQQQHLPTSSNVQSSIQSGMSNGNNSFGTPSQASLVGNMPRRNSADPDDQEQALFEQRLCEDAYGVAVRKINHNGKSNLRYVKCCWMDAYELEHDMHSTTRSVSSRVSRSGFTTFSRRSVQRDRSETESLSNRDYLNSNKAGKKKVLTWGKKKDVRMPVERFVCVRKGKTTERARRNTCPASRILSLITDDPAHASLDIEAPTKVDRDKFARAFARFLDVPMEGDDMRSVRSDGTPSHPMLRESSKSAATAKRFSTSSSVPEKMTATSANRALSQNTPPSLPRSGINVKESSNAPLPMVTTAPNARISSSDHLQSKATSQARSQLPPGPRMKQQGADNLVDDRHVINQIQSNITAAQSLLRGDVPALNAVAAAAPRSQPDQQAQVAQAPQQPQAQNQARVLKNMPSSLSKLHSSQHTSTRSQAVVTTKTSQSQTANSGADNVADEGSAVSSLTGAGFDQEIVEELHQALTELRAELEDSRAEAARAVKVAEQAIQSAENSTAKDWNSTVTHKAAEAAALAQKRSAEAMTKQRKAEERLEAERKSATYWKQQAEKAEEEAGELQTRAAAAEIQRAIIEEALQSEKMKSTQLTETLRHQLSPNEGASSPSKVHERIKAFEHGGQQLSIGAGADIKEGDKAAQRDIKRLKEKLAKENTLRRKLQHEVQDLRGAVRVYCRPRPSGDQPNSTVSVPSRELLLLHRDRFPMQSDNGFVNTFPLSFEFDGVFDDEMNQSDVYNEVESICLSALDGFNVCVLAHGQNSAGKTHTIFGDACTVRDVDDTFKTTINNFGVHLQYAEQLFAVIARRTERYKDTVTMSIIEVHDERLCDGIAGTPVGDSKGKVTNEELRRKPKKRTETGEDVQGSPTAKLEIKTNHNGETVVQGLLTVEVSSFDDLMELWHQCLNQRAARLAEQGIDATEYEASSHLIATMKIVSSNTTTQTTTCGKIQFVDLAGSDVTSRKLGKDKRPSTPEAMLAGIGNSKEWKFANRSLETLSQVVTARSQFVRTVPYRNSTLTHLLRDNLEADTKVIVLACVSSEPEDIQNTACTLRMASKMRRIIVGTATKHSINVE